MTRSRPPHFRLDFPIHSVYKNKLKHIVVNEDKIDSLVSHVLLLEQIFYTPKCAISAGFQFIIAIIVPHPSQNEKNGIFGRD